MGDAAPFLRHVVMERALSQKLEQEFEDFFPNSAEYFGAQILSVGSLKVDLAISSAMDT